MTHEYAAIEFNALTGQAFSLAAFEDHRSWKMRWRVFQRSQLRFAYDTDEKTTMNLEVELLKLLPGLFNALDSLIENYGVYLYLVFVWLALLAIAWILSGGLRLKRTQGSSVTVAPAIIFTIQSPSQPPPPIICIEVDQTWNGDDETKDEP